MSIWVWLWIVGGMVLSFALAAYHARRFGEGSVGTGLLFFGGWLFAPLLVFVGLAAGVGYLIRWVARSPLWGQA